ncbi:MAG TPA: hypothetical protein VHX49_14170 [Candidatus Acidoferrales bacterium]|nr:hypothetical protein [Candidatus Acidoferrales bacterium]
MKTTVEIPEDVFRRAKSAAAKRGIPLRELVTEALKDKLDERPGTNAKPWMAGFGKLRVPRKENARINRIIEREFERI